MNLIIEKQDNIDMLINYMNDITLFINNLIFINSLY